jgi:7-cyano-7-deazaguanine synthase
MDSTIALFDRLSIARKEGGRVHALTFSYGQRHSAEIGHARMIMAKVASSQLYGPVMGRWLTHKIHMPAFGSLLGGEPVRKYANVAEAEAATNDNSFVPYRNMVFLAQAAQYAYELGVTKIATGLRGGFPDCTETFEHLMGAIMREAVPDWPIEFVTITHRSRADCIAIAMGIPECKEALAISMTCFEGQDPPCGHCLPCLKRAQGFENSGIPDPIYAPRYTRGMSGFPPD